MKQSKRVQLNYNAWTGEIRFQLLKYTSAMNVSLKNFNPSFIDLREVKF